MANSPAPPQPAEAIEYASPHTATARRGVALIVLPAAATAVTLGVAVHSFLEEPFGVLDVEGALIQVGGPLIGLGLWVAWAVVAVRRRRPRRAALLLLLGWAALNLWIGYVFLTGYFREPWND